MIYFYRKAGAVFLPPASNYKVHMSKNHPSRIIRITVKVIVESTHRNLMSLPKSWPFYPACFQRFGSSLRISPPPGRLDTMTQSRIHPHLHGKSIHSLQRYEPTFFVAFPIRIWCFNNWEHLRSATFKTGPKMYRLCIGELKSCLYASNMISNPVCIHIYPSSHSHGSPKWVPSIVVTFQT